MRRLICPKDIKNEMSVRQITKLANIRINQLPFPKNRSSKSRPKMDFGAGFAWKNPPQNMLRFFGLKMFAFASCMVLVGYNFLFLVTVTSPFAPLAWPFTLFPCSAFDCLCKKWY